MSMVVIALLVWGKDLSQAVARGRAKHQFGVIILLLHSGFRVWGVGEGPSREAWDMAPALHGAFLFPVGWNTIFILMLSWGQPGDCLLLVDYTSQMANLYSSARHIGGKDAGEE
jgi:hypothetical protein